MVYWCCKEVRVYIVDAWGIQKEVYACSYNARYFLHVAVLMFQVRCSGGVVSDVVSDVVSGE